MLNTDVQYIVKENFNSFKNEYYWVNDQTFEGPFDLLTEAQGDYAEYVEDLLNN